MKILRISPSFPSKELPGSGLNVYQHAICSRHDSEILIEDRNYELFELGSSKIYKIKTSRTQLRRDGTLIERALQILRKIYSIIIFTVKAIQCVGNKRYDVVHCYTPIYMLVGVYYKLFHKARLVVSLHGTDFLTLKKLKLLWIIRRIPDRVYVVSASMLDELKSRGYYNVDYIGNGYNPEIFYNMNLDRRSIVVSVGGLRWQKGYDLLINSFYKSDIYKNGYELHVIGVGDQERELRILSQKLGLSNKIKFLGSFSQPEISRYLNSCDFYVLSSISEGSPKAVLEALASGLPVLATNVGDLPNMISPEIGRLVSIDPDSISNGLKVMCNMSFDRKYISEVVRSRTWTSIVENIDCLYESI